MNLSKLFDIQKAIDATYSNVEERLSKDILWLMEELGELAREWRGHKYRRPENEQRPRTEIAYETCGNCYGIGWIGDKCETKCPIQNCDNGELIRNPLLEEYTDCLSIILSIGLQIVYPDFEMSWLEPFGTEETLTYFKNVYKDLVNLTWSIENPVTLENGCAYDHYSDFVMEFMDLGVSLGFTWDQIEANYIAKAEANAKRNA